MHTAGDVCHGKPAKTQQAHGLRTLREIGADASSMAFGAASLLPQLGATRSKLVTKAVRVAFVVVLALSAALAAAFHHIQGPVILAFLPICATVWIGADLLTAYLFLSQFYVDGKAGSTILAAAYGLTGLLAIPYLLAFPGLFQSGPLSIGDLQISIWLFVLWHTCFPLCIIGASLFDPTLARRVIAPGNIPRVLTGSVALTIVTAATLTAAIYFGRNHLPVLVVAHGRLTALYSTVVAPAFVGWNALGLIVILRRCRKATRLQIWLGIALFTALLDGILNALSPSRYSVVWYVGKLEAVLTSTVVLFMLLVGFSSLYRRLYDIARKDSLTGLDNRRVFEERFDNALQSNRRTTNHIALLMIDVDHFKQYNDRYGHAAGDDALRLVAVALQRSLQRTTDLVARIGGEEFIILLPETSLEGAQQVANRIRAEVLEENIVHESVPLGRVTVSIGIGFSERKRNLTPTALFERADRALYDAKAAGRNQISTRTEAVAERV